MAQQAVFALFISLVIVGSAYKCQHNGKTLSPGEIYSQSQKYCFEVKCTINGMVFLKKDNCDLCKVSRKRFDESNQKVLEFEENIKGLLVDDLEATDKNRGSITIGKRLAVKKQKCTYNQKEFRNREVIDFINFPCLCLFIACKAQYGSAEGAIRVYKKVDGPCSPQETAPPTETTISITDEPTTTTVGPTTTSATTAEPTTTTSTTAVPITTTPGPCLYTFVDNSYSVEYCVLRQYTTATLANGLCQDIGYQKMSEFEVPAKYTSFQALTSSVGYDLVWVNGIKVNGNWVWVTSNSVVNYTIYEHYGGNCLFVYLSASGGSTFTSSNCEGSHKPLCEKSNAP